jgi:hypothetical protein
MVQRLQSSMATIGSKKRKRSYYSLAPHSKRKVRTMSKVVIPCLRYTRHTKPVFSGCSALRPTAFHRHTFIRRGLYKSSVNFERAVTRSLLIMAEGAGCLLESSIFKRSEAAFILSIE